MIYKTFTYDMSKQTIIDHSLHATYKQNASVEYKLGQILTNFLNYDFSSYDKKRRLADKIFSLNYYDYGIDDDRFENSKDYQKHVQYINNLISTFFPHIVPSYTETNDSDILHDLATYLLNLVSDFPYFQDYAFLSYEAFKDNSVFDFKTLQKKYTLIFTYCLDLDIEPSKSSLQKYMELYDYSYFMSGVTFTEKTIFRYSYSEEEQASYEIDKYGAPAKSKFALINENSEWRKREIEIIHGYVFEEPEEALQCEFLKMLELGIKIRKCAVCGKYFIITGHNGKCCDNLYKDTGLTCQQVFADRNYKNKRKKNPVLKEYDKAYKRMYARYSSKKNLTSDEYAKWKNEAAQERDKALKAYAENPSDTVINNFKQFLNNK